MHDVIVAGAGPSGALAALRLAEAGARVLLVEKHKLPRPKACGGALTVGPVKALLGWDFDDLVEAHVDTSVWQCGDGAEVRKDFGYGAWMINRSAFDMHIVERALRAGGGGVELRDGIALAGISESADGVTATLRGGEQCRARFLIGADGAAGVCSLAVNGGRKTRPALAIDSEIQVPTEVFATEGRQMRFDLGAAPGGYGWVFPKAGYLSCGVGSWTRSPGMPGLLDAYLAKVLPAGAVVTEQRRGHPIPIWDGPTRISTARICLVGDAASLVEPILGEGIRFALHSGAIAAGIVTAKLAGELSDPDGLEHSRRIYREIGHQLELLRRFVLPIFLARPDKFLNNFVAEDGDYLALARELSRRFNFSSEFPAMIADKAQSAA